MRTEALEYAERGFSIIPCKPDKKPFISWAAYQKRRADPGEIEAWFKKWPGANVGIITGSISNVSVIDVDDLETGMAALADLLPDHDIPTAETPSGGKHFYFKAPEKPMGNNTRILPGCDFRCEGGYVVAPPSKGKQGGYKWLIPLETELPPLPEAYIEIINSLSLNNSPGAVASSSEHKTIFTHYRDCNACNAPFAEQGTRDDALFRVANACVKGGLPEQECLQVLEILARSCNPPFPEKEVRDKVESALKRTNKRDCNVSEEVFNFVSVTRGYFSVTDCYSALRGVTSNRTAVRVALHRLVERGLIERHKDRDGLFRQIDLECPEIDFLNASKDHLDIHWPFSIERYVRMLPKNVAVIAGQSDAGKTAFLLNFAKMNMDDHDINYLSSEMGEVEFRDRLSKFPFPLTDWKFKPRERSGNFSDVIKPDSINIIDFLEMHDDFYKVGGQIKEIFDKLKKGIAVIALQKNAGTDYGLGGQRSLEKARLYLAMSPGVMKVVKAKNWTTSINPNGLECEFKIVMGCEFKTVIDWHKPGK